MPFHLKAQDPCVKPLAATHVQDQYQQVLAQLSAAEDATALELIEHAGGIPTV